MKSADVMSSIYIDFNWENNKGDPKFEVDDHLRISKYKNKVSKGYTSNWTDGIFVIKKVKMTFRIHMLLVIVMEFKVIQKEFRV